MSFLDRYLGGGAFRTTLDKYLTGWSFRTTHPSFEVGEEISVFVTGYENGTAVVRVGDTVIRVPDAPDGLLDRRVRVRVTDFAENDHVGEAEYLETVGESAF
ncbi:DUF7513 family protein [Halegenticoccus soli]|uniref:DUF7513 family protein n=1 Tax=Halegenticoccus soli TaxID=1985678 RepID=UPI0018EBB9B9|nr:hypothetical protein [Halegenticoccus soli]